MRATVTIDDALYERALEVADPAMDKADVWREAMSTFVRIQTAKRLAALGLSSTPSLAAERWQFSRPACLQPSKGDAKHKQAGSIDRPLAITDV